MTPIQNITEQAYTAFIHWYGLGKQDNTGKWINKPHAIETVAKLNIHCKSCVKRAVKLGHVETNFAEDVKHVGSVPKKEEHVKVLNEEEQNALRKVLTTHSNRDGFANIFSLLSLATGLRFSECSGLTWDCIDWKKGAIKINKTWDFLNNDFAPTKNSSSNRVISIDDVTLSYLNTIKEYQLKNGVNFKNLVFYQQTRRIAD